MAAIRPATGTHTHTMTISAIAQAGKTQQSTLQVSPVSINTFHICTCVSLFAYKIPHSLPGNCHLHTLQDIIP